VAYAIDVGDIFEIQAVGKLDGQTTRNTFHYFVTENDGGATGPNALDDIGQRFFDLIWLSIQSGISHEWVFSYISVQKIYPTRYRPDHLEAVDVGADETGGDANDSLPSGASVVLSRFAEKSDPEYQGRIYLAGIPTSDVDLSICVPLAKVKYEGMAALLTVALDVAAGFTLVPTLTKEGSFEVAADHLIKGSACDGVVRYQRRREVGRGE
jgi:hypothetical protein